MNDVLDIIEENILQQVRRDLRPPPLLVHAKIGGAVAIGGVLSLFLCGQLGLGLSSLANTVHVALMDVAGFVGCTVVCATLFSVVPILILRLTSSPLQFLVLIRDKWRVSAGWVSTFGVLLSLKNGRADDLFVLVIWTLVAACSFAMGSRALHHLFDTAPWRIRASG